MRISKGFIKRSFLYTIAGTLPMGSAIILLPFYVAYLSPSDFGALSVYFAFSLFIQILTTYSFDTSVYIHFHEYKNEGQKLSSFISSAFVLMLFIGMSVGIVFTLSGDFIFSKVFSEKPISFYPYGLMTAATGIFQALFKVHSNLLQSRERAEVFFWSNFISFGLIALFTIIGLKLYPNTLVGPIGGRLAAAGVAGIWALFRIFREFGIHFNYPLLRSSFSFNAYTFLYQLLQWVINYIDRIIMVFYLALADVGIYDFAAKCLLMIEFIMNGLHSTIYPKVVSRIMEQQEKSSTPEINRYYHGFMIVVLILICSCILTFPWIIETFVHKPGFEATVQFIPYIALVYIFRAMRLFYTAPYGILKYTKPLPLIYGVISAVKIGLTILLLARFSVYGVIASSIISAILEIVLLRYSIGDRFTFRYNFFKVVIAPSAIFLMIVILEPLFGKQMPFLLHSGYLIVCIAVLAWIYRNELKLLQGFKMFR